MLKKSVYTSIKNSKPFLLWDILVYAVVAITVLFLFLALVIIPKDKRVEGFEITLKGQTVLNFTFEKEEFEISEQAIVDVESVENGYLITVYQDDFKKSFNKIFIDTKNFSAKITESTCSSSKDCTFSPEIKNQGAIYCAPHSLKITPIGTDGFTPPVVG